MGNRRGNHSFADREKESLKIRRKKGRKSIGREGQLARRKRVKCPASVNVKNRKGA